MRRQGDRNQRVNSKPNDDIPLNLIVVSALMLAILALMAVYFLAPAPRAEIVFQQSACIGGCHGR